MLDEAELILIIRLYEVEVRLVQFTDLLVELFNRRRALQGFFIVIVSPVHYTGSI